MTRVQAYSDGYEAYLRLYGQAHDADEMIRARDEATPDPYVDDPALYRAWLEGWEDGGGRFRPSWDYAYSTDVAVAPAAIPSFGSGAPFGFGRTQAAFGSSLHRPA
jgi:hypothetical protein